MSALFLSTVLCGGLFANVAPAEKLEVSATVMAGTGMSLAGVAKHTLAARSPTFLIGEVAIAHPNLDWLELAPSLMLEVEGRVGFALLPKIRARLPGKRVRIWATAGLPVFVAPYSMLGVQAGAGISIKLHARVALVGEFTATAYVWGSDLMKGAALAKLDETFGVRVFF
jgi:hypothetical protein